jgi:hypothetical protein
MLIFGDNLQVLKSLLEMKKDGNLGNDDGSNGAGGRKKLKRRRERWRSGIL